MAKITEYTLVNKLSNDDVLLVDGTKGTKIIKAVDAANQLAEKMFGGYDVIAGDKENSDRINNIKADIMNTAISKELTGSAVGFEDGAKDVGMKSVVVNVDLMQSGIGDPSPNNVRPLISRDSINVTVAGKNLANLISDGKVPSTTTGALEDGTGCRTDYIKVISGDDYVLERSTVGSASWYMLFYDKNKTFLQSVTCPGDRFAQTPPEDAVWMMLRLDTIIDDVNYVGIGYLTLDATGVDNWKEYVGRTYSVAVPETTDPLYAGTLNVVTGEFTTNKACIVLNGTYPTPFNSPDTCHMCWIEVKDMARSDDYRDALWCDVCPTIAKRLEVGSTANAICGYEDNDLYVGLNYLYLRINSNTTADELNAYLAQNPVTVVYTSNTTRTYQLTPTEVESLLGDNYVWSDTGDISIEYVVDTTTYIDKKILEMLSQ